MVWRPSSWFLKAVISFSKTLPRAELQGCEIVQMRISSVAFVRPSAFFGNVVSREISVNIAMLKTYYLCGMKLKLKFIFEFLGMHYNQGWTLKNIKHSIEKNCAYAIKDFDAETVLDFRLLAPTYTSFFSGTRVKPNKWSPL